MASEDIRATRVVNALQTSINIAIDYRSGPLRPSDNMLARYAGFKLAEYAKLLELDEEAIEYIATVIEISFSLGVRIRREDSDGFSSSEFTEYEEEDENDETVLTVEGQKFDRRTGHEISGDGTRARVWNEAHATRPPQRRHSLES